MPHYSEAAVERAMKVQEVILRAAAKQITWIQAAEILGVSPRHMRRWKEKYEQFGFHALFDGRRGRTSPRRVPSAVLDDVLRLYREQYFDLNVSHFHEKLTREHGFQVSYTWTKGVLQGAGLVKRAPRRGIHRKRRARRPLPGMLLHIDASKHQWFGDERWHDLIVILDDATSEIYYAHLVEEESTRTVMRAIRQVVEEQGLCCSLYSDRARHFFLTPRAGEPVDRQALTQVGRALRELGIQLIPAYSPQARGRSERSFRTWQGRLPQELRLAGVRTREGANRFLEEGYIAEFNRGFSVAAEDVGTAFVPCTRTDLDRVFALQHERMVARDNTVSFDRLTLQIERQRWRATLAGCRVLVYEHLDGTLSLGFGAHVVGRYSSEGEPLAGAVGKDEVAAQPKAAKRRAA
jgi:transposase